jgi:hypothetical protein
MTSFSLCKSIYSNEDIESGAQAYNQYITSIEIREDGRNYLLEVHLHKDVEINENEVLGNFFNYILMSSIESKTTTE